MKKHRKKAITKPRKSKSRSVIKFSPDAELLAFAESFSDHYKVLTAGEYVSDNRKYQITYFNRIRDQYTRRVINTGARVSQNTGIIHLDKFIFKNKAYNNDYIFYVIMWCVIEYQYKDIMLSDRIALQYYLSTGRSKQNILIAQGELFKTAPSNLNIKRAKIMSKILMK